MSDLAATNCGCGCDDNCGGGFPQNFGDCNCIIWILLLMNLFGNGCNGDGCGCGCGGDNSCMLLILLLLFCGNGHGCC